MNGECFFSKSINQWNDFMRAKKEELLSDFPGVFCALRNGRLTYDPLIRFVGGGGDFSGRIRTVGSDVRPGNGRQFGAWRGRETIHPTVARGWRQTPSPPTGQPTDLGACCPCQATRGAIRYDKCYCLVSSGRASPRARPHLLTVSRNMSRLWKMKMPATNKRFRHPFSLTFPLTLPGHRDATRRRAKWPLH